MCRFLSVPFICSLFDLDHSEYYFYPWLIIGVGTLLWSILYLSSHLMHWVWFLFGMWNSATDCTSFLFGAWRWESITVWFKLVVQETESIWCLGSVKSFPEYTLIHHLNSINVVKTTVKFKEYALSWLYLHFVFLFSENAILPSGSDALLNFLCIFLFCVCRRPDTVRLWNINTNDY